MANIAISVRNLSKRFTIDRQRNGNRAYRTLHDDLLGLPARFWARLRANRPFSEEIWALNDVTFEVKKGEVLGIIGRNGAGKSTLLKILSRIMKPTSGAVDIYGRVGALLEVGTGFHPELTGRENIFLNGVILGMSRREVRRKFDEIVSFSEVEKFLDTPVKHYSSGMHVRLAFAVAAHLDPALLLIDEVLAVGDAKFQKKCLGKMEDVARTEGRTVLFVTHNLGAVAQLCPKTIWIDGGRIRRSGATSEVIAHYVTHQTRRGEALWQDGVDGRDEVFNLLAVRLRNSEGAVASNLESIKPFSIEIDYEVMKPMSNLRVGFSLSTSTGVCLFEAYDSDDVVVASIRQPGRYTARCSIAKGLLTASTYLVSVTAVLPGQQTLARVEDVLTFDVEDTAPRMSNGERKGIIQPQVSWTQQVCNGRGVSSVR